MTALAPGCPLAARPPVGPLRLYRPAVLPHAPAFALLAVRGLLCARPRRSP
ncbi:hypothetical protein [Streptomyces sp. NPDC047841]|uniref:hypothetical protein n=1 Tax=Streptomyces sp. NPDC047841 TaxID=3154708 RepID=UPI003456A9F0